jgi:hypothetical protein
MRFAEAVKLALYYSHRTPRPMPGITVSVGALEQRATQTSTSPPRGPSNRTRRLSRLAHCASGGSYAAMIASA